MGWKRLFASIFLTALIPICLADPRDICPPKELITPCSCKPHFEDERAMVRCASVEGKEVIVDALNKTHDYGYEYLWIDLSSVTYIPFEIFEIKKISYLIIMDTTMVSLFDKAPETEDLQRFTAYRLKLSRAIQWELFTGLTNLRNLTIEDSPLRNIDEEFVKYAPKSLERITISNCSISKLHDEAFAGITNLIDFIMDKGKIKVVKRSMWPSPANKLKTFSMKNQLIESLPEDLFKDMSRLTHIWLTGNLISQISENTFKEPFTILRSCLLDENPIKCDCSIRWLAEITEREGSFWRNLIGRCEDPKNLHGVYLTDLRPSHFEHCARI